MSVARARRTDPARAVVDRCAVTFAAIAVASLAAAACGPDQRQSLPSSDAAEGLPAGAEVRDSADPGAGIGGWTSARDTAELVAAAERVVAFLRGELGFDAIRVADSVTLLVSPEGGGARSVVAREQLREPAAWRVRDDGGAVYVFAPPSAATELTTAVGRHLNCRDYDLATRDAELARYPHVGTMLAPPDAQSCLQTWNLTLVFAAAATPPTLIAAVYDQWEW